MSKTKLTPTGIVWGTLFALALIGGWAAGQLAPASSIGAWFATPSHFVAAFMACGCSLPLPRPCWQSWDIQSHESIRIENVRFRPIADINRPGRTN